MWSAIRAFFSRLFGNSTPEPNPAPSDPVKGPEQPQTHPAEQVAGWQLTRLEKGANGIKGALRFKGEPIAETLESINHLKSGTYPLVLKQSGGLHATYAFRFGELHKGVIAIAESEQHVYLQMGHDPAYAYGSILVGTSCFVQENELVLLGTEAGYRLVYEQLVPMLESNIETSLTISESF